MDTDDKPEKITYKKFIDQLHPARFERHPTTAPSKWWSNVPIKRTNIIKKIPLRHLGNFQTYDIHIRLTQIVVSGANHMIPAKTIINAHDRSKTLMSK